MDNIFYSEDEKIVFWIAGYTRIDNTNSVDEQIEGLNEKRNEFLSLFNSETKPAPEKVKTIFVDNSRRYKYMRVFYLENIEPNQVPEKAFKITNKNGWTMWKWLKD